MSITDINPADAEETWSTIIRPKSRFFSLNLRELFSYRDLVGLLAKRDISTIYKQTVLGPLWFVIQPIATTIIYTFVFGNLAKLSTDGLPRTLFYFGGTMLWHYFQTTLLNISDTFIVNAHIFGKVYFPRLAMPLSKVISNLAALIVQLAVLAVLFLHYLSKGMVALPGFMVLLIPLIILWIVLLAAGFGMIICALTTKYRDLRQFITFGMGLWMYATPVVYPMSQISPRLRAVMSLNPISAPIELFRKVAYGVGNPEPRMIWFSICSTILLFLFGLMLFHRTESTFVDVI